MCVGLDVALRVRSGCHVGYGNGVNLGCICGVNFRYANGVHVGCIGISLCVLVYRVLEFSGSVYCVVCICALCS